MRNLRMSKAEKITFPESSHGYVRGCETRVRRYGCCFLRVRRLALRCCLQRLQSVVPRSARLGGG
jgi:hypothetical protein